VQRFLTLFQKIASAPQLRKKLLFTAGVFLVFRVLAHIPLPGVDITRLEQLFNGSQFLSLLNVFSGGTLARFSIAAVGINPYITASIVMQLAGMVIPKLKEMQADCVTNGNCTDEQGARIEEKLQQCIDISLSSAAKAARAAQKIEIDLAPTPGDMVIGAAGR